MTSHLAGATALRIASVRSGQVSSSMERRLAALREQEQVLARGAMPCVETAAHFIAIKHIKVMAEETPFMLAPNQNHGFQRLKLTLVWRRRRIVIVDDS